MKEYHLQIENSRVRETFMTWLKARLTAFGTQDSVSQTYDTVTWTAPADME